MLHVDLMHRGIFFTYDRKPYLSTIHVHDVTEIVNVLDEMRPTRGRMLLEELVLKAFYHQLCQLIICVSKF
jgi:hypothetical protein